MRYTLIYFALTFLFSCSSPSTPADNNTVSEEDRKTLTYLKEVEWPKAYREQDTVLLDRILGEDFQFIDGDGNLFSKKDEMDWIKKQGTNYDSFYYEIKRLDILKNGTAIISGTGHIFQDTTESIYQSSNYLEKRNGIWKAFSSHVSGFKKLEPEQQEN